MRTKKVTRYYCDHCGKGGFFVDRMTKHEIGCTANPNRACGMCNCAELEQQDLETLNEALQKDIAANKTTDEFHYELEIPNLRDAASNCPACILSVLRKAKSVYAKFDVKEEFRSFWLEVNLSRERST